MLFIPEKKRKSLQDNCELMYVKRVPVVYIARFVDWIGVTTPSSALAYFKPQQPSHILPLP